MLAGIVHGNLDSHAATNTGKVGGRAKKGGRGKAKSEEVANRRKIKTGTSRDARRRKNRQKRRSHQQDDNISHYEYHVHRRYPYQYDCTYRYADKDMYMDKRYVVDDKCTRHGKVCGDVPEKNCLRKFPESVRAGKSRRKKIMIKAERGASYFKKPSDDTQFSAAESQQRSQRKKGKPRMWVIFAVIATITMVSMTSGQCHRSMMVGPSGIGAEAVETKLQNQSLANGSGSKSSEISSEDRQPQEEVEKKAPSQKNCREAPKGNGIRKALPPPVVKPHSAKARYANRLAIRGIGRIQLINLRGQYKGRQVVEQGWREGHMCKHDNTRGKVYNSNNHQCRNNNYNHYHDNYQQCNDGWERGGSYSQIIHDSNMGNSNSSKYWQKYNSIGTAKQNCKIRSKPDHDQDPRGQGVQKKVEKKAVSEHTSLLALQSGHMPQHQKTFGETGKKVMSRYCSFVAPNNTVSQTELSRIFFLGWEWEP